MHSSDGRGAARPPVLLLVEDNPADIRLAQEVLRMAGFEHELLLARDGEQALRLLRRGSGYESAPRPALVLLDLNLPRLDGRSVLREIKQDPALLRIPVIVLSTSKADSDVSACYDAHANCYLVKPVDVLEFTRLVELIRDFWFGVVQLPPA
ncbi:response regulator [Fontimonas sp. SYSU GA230001]|uniref:response regulator n=1 Tax=Fontimonas sp. SYSU GA230001 TaxID=3142450 RepID=UPI0032B5307D